MNRLVVTGVLAAGSFAMVLIPSLRRRALARGITDQPSPRKVHLGIHLGPTPYLGGVVDPGPVIEDALTGAACVLSWMLRLPAPGGATNRGGFPALAGSEEVA